MGILKEMKGLKSKIKELCALSQRLGKLYEMESNMAEAKIDKISPKSWRKIENQIAHCEKAMTDIEKIIY